MARTVQTAGATANAAAPAASVGALAPGKKPVFAHITEPPQLMDYRLGTRKYQLPPLLTGGETDEFVCLTYYTAEAGLLQATDVPVRDKISTMATILGQQLLISTYVDQCLAACTDAMFDPDTWMPISFHRLNGDVANDAIASHSPLILKPLGDPAQAPADDADLRGPGLRFIHVVVEVDLVTCQYSGYKRHTRERKKRA